jgi:hypothetical protein
VSITVEDKSGELTAEQRFQARQVFEGVAQSGVRPCVHCGGVHLRACRRVKAVKWHVDGTVIEAEYWPDGQWDEAGIIWPEDAYEDDAPTVEEQP